MLESKKTTYILGIILFLGIVVVVILLIMDSNVSQENSNNNSNNSTVINNNLTINNNNEIVTNNTLESINSYSEFNLVINIINNFYSNCFEENYVAAYNMLDDNYISNNRITKNNISEKFPSNIGEYTYSYIDMVKTTSDNNKYYFVNGTLTTSPVEEGDTSSILKTYIVATKGNSYVIVPLNYIEDIESYAKKYNLNTIKIKQNDDNKYSTNKITDRQLINLYIAYFQSLLFENPEKAYNILDIETKNKFNGYEDFYNQRMDYYNKINVNYFGYQLKGSDFNYTITLQYNDNSMVYIHETGYMEFTISF